jgi:Cof subfamily protein (haloacid dehalogenase superfamily)
MPAAPQRLLIAADVDGTLLSTETADRLQPREIAALDAVRAAGHVVALCTGRNRQSLEAMLDRSGWHPADLPKVMLNGAMVDGGAGVGVLAHNELDRDVVDRLVRLFREHRAVPMVYAGDGDGGTLLHERGEINPVLAQYLDHRRERVGAITDVDDLTGHLPPTSLEVGTIDLEPVIAPLTAAVRAELGGAVRVINTRSLLGGGRYFWAEVYHHACSKGTGVQLLADRLGFGAADIVAVGDNYNDVDMFAVAAVSVAVAGGPDDVQASADMVVGGVADGGVADLLERIADGRFGPPAGTSEEST